MAKLNYNIKLIFRLIIYWFTFITIPIILVYIFRNKKDLESVMKLVFLYTLFWGPIFCSVVYKLIDLMKSKYKSRLVLWWLVLPYSTVCIYMLYQFILIKGLIF